MQLAPTGRTELMRVHRFHASAFSAGILILTCSIVSAQQSTSATYSDWVLQCVNQAGTPSKKICEIAQTTRVRGKNVTFSRVAVEGPVTKGKPVKLIIQLPVNASVRDPVKLDIPGTSPSSELLAPFDRCVPGGCFADIDMKDDVLRRLNGTEGMGKVTFKDAAGRDIAFPLSLKGFHSAFDALTKTYSGK
jgi:invasion protein IalB